MLECEEDGPEEGYLEQERREELKSRILYRKRCRRMKDVVSVLAGRFCRA